MKLSSSPCSSSSSSTGDEDASSEKLVAFTARPVMEPSSPVMEPCSSVGVVVAVEELKLEPITMDDLQVLKCRIESLVSHLS